MEEDEVALSDVHVGDKWRATNRKETSDFPTSTDASQQQQQQQFQQQQDVTVCEGKYSYNVYLSEFTFERESHDSMKDGEAGMDEDGDFVIQRPDKDLYHIKIEHTLSTRLVDVGHQVWKGSLLLSDFILANPYIFDGVMALELGAGVGLASIAMATMARKVICTDIGGSVLRLCARNAALNRELYKHGGRGTEEDVVVVRELDWTETSRRKASCVTYGWSDEDEELLSRVTVILAADVIYSEDLTSDFFLTVTRLMSKPPDKVLYIAAEKRYNFTLDDMDVSCPAYDHFLSLLNNLSQPQAAGTSFTVQQMATDYPQHLRYERSCHLVLWKISAKTGAR